VGNEAINAHAINAHGAVWRGRTQGGSSNNSRRSAAVFTIYKSISGELCFNPLSSRTSELHESGSSPSSPLASGAWAAFSINGG
jgi:hypothetical protein